MNPVPLEQLTLADLQSRLQAIPNMPPDAAQVLAAAVYYYLPFPPELRAAWHAARRHLVALAELVAELQTGPEGESPDYGPWARQLLAALEAVADAPPGFDDERNGLFVHTDGAGNASAFMGGEWSSAPPRQRDRFLLLGVAVLESHGLVRSSALEVMRDVLAVIEGKRVDVSSVKRAHNRAHSAYAGSFPFKSINLDRLEAIMSQPDGRYVLIPCPPSKEGQEQSKAAPPSNQPRGHSISTADSPGADKSLPAAMSSPEGPFANWARTGRVPRLDQLPINLSLEGLQTLAEILGIPFEPPGTK
ncbi:MAG: hypothetical protein SF187_02400 [Deltaproteobacteria bacterium]|nr:hypothetical protein [Deltaproteobacteria bacterium]